jgi:hypothetical protein
MKIIVLIISIFLMSAFCANAQQNASSKINAGTRVVRNQPPDQNTAAKLMRYNQIMALPDSQKISPTHCFGQVDTNMATSPHFLGWDTIITPTMRYYPPPRPEDQD